MGASHIFKAWSSAYKVFFLGASGSYLMPGKQDLWRLLGLRLG